MGEPFTWSRYNRRCSVCSTWAHFTLQHTASLYGPLAERPEALPPGVPSPEGEIGLTAPTRRRLMMPPQLVQKDIAAAAQAAAPCRCCTLAMLSAEVHIFSGTESV